MTDFDWIVTCLGCLGTGLFAGMLSRGGLTVFSGWSLDMGERTKKQDTHYHYGKTEQDACDS